MIHVCDCDFIFYDMNVYFDLFVAVDVLQLFLMSSEMISSTAKTKGGIFEIQ